MENNYVVYHLHDDKGSLLDSCTKWEDYVDLAASYGMKAIASTNHGYILNWTAKKQYAEKKGLKFIVGCEVYLTAQMYHESDNKVRDNFHTILLCKNAHGVSELNELMSKSYDNDHKYYKPRITFDDFFSLSDNIIKISACLASPLHRYNDECVDYDANEYDKLCATYDYYEIQYHDCDEQKEYNRYLWELSKKYHKPLIAATDTHSLNTYKAECRKILMEAKGIEFTGEDEYDLTFKSYSELVSAFTKQNSLPREIWLEAIENTNRMANSVKDFTLSTKARYPILTGSTESDADTYIKRVRTMLDEKIAKGIIPESEAEVFRQDTENELQVFKKTNMLGFMLSMSDLMIWGKKNGIPFGPSRGSVAGSRCAFVTDIIDVDPVKWNLVFSRFCNENRVEIGDIDIDVPDSYRPQIYNHIFDSFGKEKCAYVLAMGTLAGKATIDEIGRALAKEWKRKNQEKDESENPYSLKKIAQIKKQFELDVDKCREDNPDIFYYFDGLQGTVVSLSHHPAGVIIAPINLYKRYGVFQDKDGLSVLNLDMEASHAVGLAKYDILGLDTVAVIDKTCKLANVSYPHTWEIDFEDEKVWEDMKKSQVGIFQFVENFAFDSLKKYDVYSIADLSLVTAAIRPGGASYRDKLFQHIENHNPSIEIDELLKDSLGWLVFQEQTIAFLQQFCDMSGGDADSIRRAIGHKNKEELDKAIPRILDGYCKHSNKERTMAENEAKAFLKIIEDSASYQFGLNHATGYSILTYYCAYYRYYYPYEFVTALLNTSDTQEKIIKATQLAGQRGIQIMPIKFRHSKDEYVYDKNDKKIYQGMESIKYLNKKVSREFYKLRNDNFDSFIDLLIVNQAKRIADSRQLDILVKLDFFSEFGSPNQLLAQIDIFNKYYGVKQLLKKDMDSIMSHDTMMQFCEKETEKKYINIDWQKLVNCLVENTCNIQTSVSDRIDYEAKHLGYIQLMIPEIANHYIYVLSVDTKFSNRNIIGYVIHNGGQIKMKVRAKTFAENPIEIGNILRIDKMKNEGRWNKDADGKWIQSKTETETILYKYAKVKKEVTQVYDKFGDVSDIEIDDNYC
jgi:DNA polymerase III subunit alpha